MDAYANYEREDHKTIPWTTRDRTLAIEAAGRDEVLEYDTGEVKAMCTRALGAVPSRSRLHTSIRIPLPLSLSRHYSRLQLDLDKKLLKLCIRGLWPAASTRGAPPLDMNMRAADALRLRDEEPNALYPLSHADRDTPLPIPIPTPLSRRRRRLQNKTLMTNISVLHLVPLGHKHRVHRKATTGKLSRACGIVNDYCTLDMSTLWLGDMRRETLCTPAIAIAAEGDGRWDGDEKPNYHDIGMHSGDERGLDLDLDLDDKKLLRLYAPRTLLPHPRAHLSCASKRQTVDACMYSDAPSMDLERRTCMRVARHERATFAATRNQQQRSRNTGMRNPYDRIDARAWCWGHHAWRWCWRDGRGPSPPRYEVCDEDSSSTQLQPAKTTSIALTPTSSSSPHDRPVHLRIDKDASPQSGQVNAVPAAITKKEEREIPSPTTDRDSSPAQPTGIRSTHPLPSPTYKLRLRLQTANPPDSPPAHPTPPPTSPGKNVLDEARHHIRMHIHASHLISSHLTRSSASQLISSRASAPPPPPPSQLLHPPSKPSLDSAPRVQRQPACPRTRRREALLSPIPATAEAEAPCLLISHPHPHPRLPRPPLPQPFETPNTGESDSIT
ncbi:hypothetical protein R3P38DRAFT_2814994 [Favolaschia claudopus]|uniref:Uncharacterized protein n=1 Tax=Favolaschia claudopus TaxID=2862362 RepID=A0AAV9Z2F1_9AGAR